jgi:hypothetical protein
MHVLLGIPFSEIVIAILLHSNLSTQLIGLQITLLDTASADKLLY